MKLLLLDTNHQLLKEGLENNGFICDENYADAKEQVEKSIHTYEGLIIRSRFSIDKVFLDKAVNLKFIARIGAGLENIDGLYAKEKGIRLIAAPEGNRNAVGEHCLALLLSLFNKLNKADKEVKQGHWRREDNRGLELDGKTVGLIGYGNMGKAFAKKLKGFETQVLCYDILSGLGDENCKQVSLEVLQEKADVVSLHVPETQKTIQMVDKTFINAFKKPFWLINTARGKSVHTADLVSGLKNGTVLGAGLDVLEYEKSSFETLFTTNELPEAFQYLINAENVLLTPHVAGWTKESKIRLAQTTLDKILASFS